MPHELSQTLAERHEQNGDWQQNAQFSQMLQQTLRQSPNWLDMPAFAREGATTIVQKLARIITGNWRHTDHWHDIAGYALRCEQELTDER